MFARFFGWGNETVSIEEETIPIEEETIPIEKETVPIEEETIPIEEVPNSSIKNFQDAIDELTEMEASFAKVTKDSEIVGSCMLLKGIDLIRFLDATVYNAKIDNKLCDVKMIQSSVKYGFSKLLCTQSGCSEKAIMCHKLSTDTLAELYCEEHSNLVDPLKEGLHYVDAELKKDISILKSLERLLVIVQEQMEYLKADNQNKDMVAYSSIEERLFKEYENLKNILSGMSLNAKQFINKEGTERTPRYEHFTFVKLDSESCVKSIHEILKLIFEVNLKLEIDAKLKTILNWSAEIGQCEEEVKSNIVYSVPEEIYGKDIELCKIPIQTLKKVKELEKKVQILAKTVIDYQNNSQNFENTIKEIKRILQMEITSKELIEQHKIEEQKILEQKEIDKKLFSELYEKYFEEKIPDISNFDLKISLNDTKQKLLMRDCVTSKLRLPDLNGIQINYISDADADLVSFLSDSTPARLKLLAVNWDRISITGIKSKFYVDAFSEAAARTTKEVFFTFIDFTAEDLQTVVRAARNVERIVFWLCCIHCSSGLDFGADLSYNTKFLSFQGCGSTYFVERTTDWIDDPPKFSLIVDAIGSSGLKASLQKLNIAWNPTLSASKVQEELNAKGMSHISVVQESSAPLSS